MKNDESEVIQITKLQLWQGVAAIFAVAFFASLFFSLPGGSANAVGQAGAQPTAAPDNAGGNDGGSTTASFQVGDDPVLGNADAPVTIIKYTDFGCPFCQRWHDQTKPQIESEYVESGQVKIVYKDSPITQLHPDAPKAHEAANCVFEEGGAEAYYDYVDDLYANQRTQNTDNLEQWASDLGYDISDCLASGRFSDENSEDQAEADQAGMRGTPHFVIGTGDSGEGTPVRGAQPFQVFQQAIEAQLG